MDLDELARLPRNTCGVCRVDIPGLFYFCYQHQEMLSDRLLDLLYFEEAHPNDITDACVYAMKAEELLS